MCCKLKLDNRQRTWKARTYRIRKENRVRTESRKNAKQRNNSTHQNLILPCYITSNFLLVAHTRNPPCTNLLRIRTGLSCCRKTILILTPKDTDTLTFGQLTCDLPVHQNLDFWPLPQTCFQAFHLLVRHGREYSLSILRRDG